MTTLDGRAWGLCEDCNQDKPLRVAAINSAYDWLCASCLERDNRERREALDEITQISEELGLYD